MYGLAPVYASANMATTWFGEDSTASSDDAAYSLKDCPEDINAVDVRVGKIHQDVLQTRRLPFAKHLVQIDRQSGEERRRFAARFPMTKIAEGTCFVHFVGSQIIFRSEQGLQLLKDFGINCVVNCTSEVNFGGCAYPRGILQELGITAFPQIVINRVFDLRDDRRRWRQFDDTFETLCSSLMNVKKVKGICKCLFFCETGSHRAVATALSAIVCGQDAFDMNMDFGVVRITLAMMMDAVWHLRPCCSFMGKYKGDTKNELKGRLESSYLRLRSCGRNTQFRCNRPKVALMSRVQVAAVEIEKELRLTKVHKVDYSDAAKVPKWDAFKRIPESISEENVAELEEDPPHIPKLGDADPAANLAPRIEANAENEHEESLPLGEDEVDFSRDPSPVDEAGLAPCKEPTSPSIMDADTPKKNQIQRPAWRCGRDRSRSPPQKKQ